MDEAAGPSRTAMMAALGRAGHLMHFGPRALLQDWLAWPFVGPDADAVWELGLALIGDDAEPLGTWFAARSRLPDDWLADAGCAQHVILGAGLDSSAWRSTRVVQVFEVDHPATQAWKQGRVAALRLPGGPVWVPLDFEHERLGPALDAAGVDERTGVFVSWLGVIPYLTTAAIVATLQELPVCSLALSYVPPEESWDDDARALGQPIMAAAASMGEPWITFHAPADLAALVGEAGFEILEDVGAPDIEPRYGIPAINFERIALARKAAS